MRASRVCAGAVLIFSLLPAVFSPAFAQSGSLTIQIQDAADGSPLPGAVVVLTNTSRLIAETSVLTDAEGRAVFPILPAGGGYVVEASMPGRYSVKQDGLRVKINQSQVYAIRLSEELVEVVSVEAKREVVDLAETETSTVFSDAFIQDLPVLGRSYTQILTLAPGVQDSDGDGNPNVHGARERDFKGIVGGVSNVDPLTGLKLSNVNIDTIEEMEIIQAGAGVEYGRAQGGFANIIEKQGSNDFEGLFSFVFRSSKLDGNGATNVSGDRVPEFGWVQPALQVSGPIAKDRLWYRLSHEYIDREDPVDVLGSIAVLRTKQTTSSDMITWQVSPRNKMAFSFLDDPLRIENVEVSSTTPTEATRTFEFGGPTYRLNWTAPMSPTLLFETVVAYQDMEQNILPTEENVPNDCVVGIGFMEAAQCTNTATGVKSGSYFQTHEDRRQRFTVKTRADVFASRFLGMGHRFKIGFDVENERYFRTLERRPDLTFFTTSTGTERVGIASARIAIPSVSRARAVGTSWALYVEDQIKPLSNLAVTLGARVDQAYIESLGHEPFDPAAEARAMANAIIPYIEAGASPEELAPITASALRSTFTAFENTSDFNRQLGKLLGLSGNALVSATLAKSLSWEKRRRDSNVGIANTYFSPFLGVSWDPFKTGKTKLALTAGRHYDKVILAVPLAEVESPTTDITFTAENRHGEWLVSQPDTVSPTLNVSVVDRNLRTPYQDEYAVTFERELAAETAIRIAYIRRSFKDQLQDIDLNHLPGDFGRCVPQRSPGDPVIEPSFGQGQEYTDLATGRTYTDTDPGIGDGLIDDCVGNWEYVPYATGATVRTAVIQSPDGLADLYVQNPGWGQIFMIGNYNAARYSGLVLELTRRQYRNWQMNASYTWSRAVGDAEDFDLILGDDRTLLEDEYGFLAYDQRHVVKVNATTIVPWAGGFRLGTAFRWESGLPYSLTEWDLRFDTVPSYLVAVATAEPRVRLQYPTRQRNDQRNESYWTFDVHLAKEFNLKGGINAQLSADAFNVLNDNRLGILEISNSQISASRRFGRRFQIGLRVAF